jgi:transposase-like protein
MVPEQQWCDNTSCREFGRVHAGNIKVFSSSEQRYYCTTCGRTFNANKGTFFETLRSDHQAITDVLAWLTERNSLRAVERRTPHPHNTILHWVDLAGQHATKVSQAVIRNLHITQAQVDELWTFVKKTRTLATQ